MILLLKLLRYFPYRQRQIYRKLVKLLKNTELITTCINSLKMKIDLKDEIGSYLFLRGVWEPKQTAFILSKLQKGMVVYDIGSNIGYYTLLSAFKVGNNGVVYSFEPVESIRRKLDENIILNSITNVKVVSTAISNKKERVNMYLGPYYNEGSSSFTKPKYYSGVSVSVDSDSIDNLIKVGQFILPQLIKIDVEGAEYKVIQGMTNLLSSQSIDLFIEINENNLKKQNCSVFDIFKLLESMNYFGYKITEKRTQKISYDDLPKKEALVYFQKLVS